MGKNRPPNLQKQFVPATLWPCFTLKNTALVMHNQNLQSCFFFLGKAYPSTGFHAYPELFLNPSTLIGPCFCMTMAHVQTLTGRKLTTDIYWYLLIQTIDWNSVQKLQQNHGIEQHSPVTYATSTLDAVETRPFSRSSGHSAFHCPCASRTSLGQRLPCPASCRDWSRPPWAFHLGRDLRFRDFTEGKNIHGK